MSRFKLPPIPGASEDVRYALERVELFLNGSIPDLERTSPSYTTSLPSNPSDGQEVYYSPEAGVIWHLRYGAGSVMTHKWEVAGASPLYDEVVTDQATANTSYVNLATVGPSAEIPLAGVYIVEIGAHCYHATSGQQGSMSYAIEAAAASDNDRVLFGSSSWGGGSSMPGVRVREKTLSAGDTLVAKYRSSNATNANFYSRWMRVIPIRVG